MGLILQMQRRAIESVFERIACTINEDTEFYLGSDRLTLLGISVGVGTCSDLHGVNIAVLSRAEPKDLNISIDFPIDCSGFVLLRDLTEPEVAEEKKSRWYIDQPRLMIEGLVSSGPIELRSTPSRINLIIHHKKTGYVPI